VVKRGCRRRGGMRRGRKAWGMRRGRKAWGMRRGRKAWGIRRGRKAWGMRRGRKAWRKLTAECEQIEYSTERAPFSQFGRRQFATRTLAVRLRE